jgi:hypothetical protein
MCATVISTKSYPGVLATCQKQLVLLDNDTLQTDLL